MKTHRFTAIIRDAGGGGAFVIVPFDVEKTFGKKRVPVHATIDGISYRGTLVRMGSPEHLLIVRKDIRRTIGKEIGDEVNIAVWEDTDERTVDIPPDLRAALEAAPDANARFEKLAYTHRREYVQHINDAKKEETRLRRIEKTIEKLRAH